MLATAKQNLTARGFTTRRQHRNLILMTIRVNGLQLMKLSVTCILKFMGSASPDFSERDLFSPSELAPPELAERAAALVKSYPECFWFWHPGSRIRSLADVRLVVEHLREYGDRRAWLAAQDLNRCLLPLSKKTS